MAKQILIIGGGVIGTMHALRLVKRGYRVVQIDRDPVPLQASVRNFGLVWVGGRRAGEELEEALLARELWDEVAADVRDLSLRSNGSLTIARTTAEVKVMEQSMALPDAEARGWQLLSAEEARQINPAVRGKFEAALYCSKDAAVEPAHLLHNIRHHLLAHDNYSWVPNTEIVDVNEGPTGPVAFAATGEMFHGDFALVCPGADHKSLFGAQLAESPIRRVRLQMMSTVPLGEELTTSVGDGDSMRYYPAYDVPALREMPPQDPIAAGAKMQLLMVQRTDGTLTIGDTHEYDEPFDIFLREPEYDYLIDVASDILGRPLPKVARRWDGVYSQRTDGAICERTHISKTIVVVTGPGGRGNSLAPAIAENTVRILGF
ncbi:MAG: TIGR03364 family FAD-dependent oxidoreductase [Actinomycetales bacterium]|nr:TIGR03364 family FAD-dependent oxidoreductase [Actinomycetales bacterium]